MALEDIFHTRHYRRSFYTVAAFLVSSLVLIRYVAFPLVDPTLGVGWASDGLRLRPTCQIEY